MQETKLVILTVIIVVSFAIVILELLSVIRKRNANTLLTKTLSKMISDKVDDGTFGVLRPPNPVQVAFIVDTVRDFQKKNATPEEFLEYMGWSDDPFSKEILSKSLQDLLGPKTE